MRLDPFVTFSNGRDVSEHAVLVIKIDDLRDVQLYRTRHTVPAGGALVGGETLQRGDHFSDDQLVFRLHAPRAELIEQPDVVGRLS